MYIYILYMQHEKFDIIPSYNCKCDSISYFIYTYSCWRIISNSFIFFDNTFKSTLAQIFQIYCRC